MTWRVSIPWCYRVLKDCYYFNRSCGILFIVRTDVYLSIRPETYLFGWFTMRSLYLVMKFVISSFIVGISTRSLCIRSLVTNQGAVAINRSVLDWNLWRISRLELAAVPHSWIPYDHMGFNIHLHSNILLPIVSSDFRSISQYILLSWRPNCLPLLNIWSLHIRNGARLTTLILTTLILTTLRLTTIDIDHDDIGYVNINHGDVDHVNINHVAIDHSWYWSRSRLTTMILTTLISTTLILITIPIDHGWYWPR